MKRATSPQNFEETAVENHKRPQNTDLLRCEDRETGEEKRLPKHYTIGNSLVEDSLPYVLDNYFNEIRILNIKSTATTQERMLLVNMKKPYFVGNCEMTPPANDYEWEVMPIMDFPVLSSSFSPEYGADVYRIANLLNPENICGYVKSANGEMKISESITRVEVQQTLNRMWSKARPLHAFKQYRRGGKWCNAQHGDHTDVGDVLEEFETRLIRKVGLSQKLVQHLQKIFKRQCKLDTFDEYRPDLSVIKETPASREPIYRDHMDSEVYVLPEGQSGKVKRGFIPCVDGENHDNTYNVVWDTTRIHQRYTVHFPDVRGVPRSRLRSKWVGDAALREAKHEYERSLPTREPPTREWDYNKPYFYDKPLDDRTFEAERKRRRVGY